MNKITVISFLFRIPLPDVVMMFIPEQDWSHRVGDLLVFLCSIVMLTVLALHKYRAIVARRVFFILGCLYWMRTISMLITQLPSAYADNEKKCRAQLKPEDRTWSVYWHRFLEQSVNIGVQVSSFSGLDESFISFILMIDLLVLFDKPYQFN